MSRGFTLHLLGWSGWTETLTTPAEWRAWAGAASGRLPRATDGLPPGDLPMMLRRRAMPTGRVALAAAAGLPHVTDARYILSTRHGELARTAAILECLSRREPPSPADFSMSVHHGLGGLLSIAFGNRKGHGAVSAGTESFCYGLLEAAACIAERPDEPVILVHYDERPEGVFAELFTEPATEGPVAAALCLGGKASDGGIPVTLRAAPRRGGVESANPFLDFIAFILTGAPEAVCHGKRMTWGWSRA